MLESYKTMGKAMTGQSVILLSLFIITGLLSCTSAPPQPTQQIVDAAGMARTSVVSTGSLNLDPRKPSTISWSTGITVVGSNDEAKTTFLKNTTQRAIENQISHKGYPLLSMAGDYQMTALLVLGSNAQKDKSPTDSLSHSDLLQNTGIDPGLAENDRAVGKGSLVIELRQGRALRWRGAVQLVILPQADPAIASLRIQYAVAQLLLTWP